MMPRWSALGLLLLALVAGCKPHSSPALQPGDIVRPQIALAPATQWPAGARVAIGMLLEVHRPGRREVAFLGDQEVPAEQAVMQARVTFLRGDSLVGEPLEVPFVRDC